MPRLKPKTVAKVLNNQEFAGKFWPRKNSAAEEKGWKIYRDRVFTQVQKYAPIPPVYQKFDKEIIARSMRLEHEVKPEKVLKQLQFDTKLDYLKMAKMVLVFHNYGLGAKDIMNVRKIAKNTRCEWIQNKTLGTLYAEHLGDETLMPLLRDGGAVLWAAYNTEEYNKIIKSLKKYDYSYKLVAGIIANPEYKHHELLFPSQLEEFGKLPAPKEFIATSLLGPLMAQPYALTATLMGGLLQLSNLLQYQLFKLKEKGGEGEGEAKSETKPEAKAEKKESGKEKEKEGGKEKEKEKEGAKKDAKEAKPKEAPKK